MKIPSYTLVISFATLKAVALFDGATGLPWSIKYWTVFDDDCPVTLFDCRNPVAEFWIS